MKSHRNIELEVFFIKEGEFVVALNAPLNLSSFGKTEEEAYNAFDEMIQLWVEETIEMGSFEQVMLDAGFSIETPSTSYKQSGTSSIAKDPQEHFQNTLLGSRWITIPYA